MNLNRARSVAVKVRESFDFPKIILLFFLIIVFGLYFQKAPLGIDLTDEGMAMAAISRLQMHDIFELQTSFRQCDFFNFIAQTLKPSLTLLDLRHASALMQMSCFGVLSYILICEVGLFLCLFALSALMFWCNQIGQPTPSYNYYAQWFLILVFALAFKIFSSNTLGNKRHWFLMGMASVSLVLAYASFLVLMGIGFLFAAWHTFKQQKVDRLLAYISGALTVLVLFTLFLIHGGIASWFENIHMFSKFYSHVSKFTVLWNLISGLERLHPWTPLIYALFFCSLIGMLIKRKYSANLYLIYWILGSIATLFAPASIADIRCFLYFTVVLVVCSLPLSFTYLFLSNDKKNLALLSFAIAGFMTFALSSFYFNPFRSYLAGTQGFPLVMFMIGITWQKALSVVSSDWLKRLFLCVIGVFSIFNVSQGYIAFRDYLYRDGPVQEMTTPFTIPKLSGIFSSKERVETLSHLKAEVEKYSSEEDYMMVFAEAPMLHYLFSRKPSSTAWIGEIYGDKLVEELLHQVVESKREPKLIIKTLINVSASSWINQPVMPLLVPLESYLQSNYERVSTIYPFEVWLRKELRPN